MYLYKQKRKDGDTYLAIKEKYYVAGKGTRERTVSTTSSGPTSLTSCRAEPGDS